MSELTITVMEEKPVPVIRERVQRTYTMGELREIFGPDETSIVMALIDKAEALQKEIDLYKPGHLTELVRRPPPIGSASMSSCGCSTWDNGLGERGEYKCAAHSGPGSDNGL